MPYAVIAFLACLLSPLPADRIAHLPAVDTSQLVWRLSDPDLLPEDFVYDSVRRRYLVTSVRRGGVFEVNGSGVATRLIEPVAGTWGTFAIGLDRSRGTLWVTTASFPGSANYTPADSAKSAILAFDLATGALRRRLVPGDGGPHALGDLTLAPDGTVYVSDGFGGAVYVVAPGSSTMRPLVAPRTFRSPQTPALSHDGSTLFVPDYSNGLARITIATGEWKWLEHVDARSFRGTDGLYRSGESLIAVQNGPSPNRLVHLTVDAAGRILTIDPLEAGGSTTDLNHGLLVGNDFYYLARSGWDRVADNGSYTPGTPGTAPELRRISLQR